MPSLGELGIVFPRTLRGKILPRRLPPLIKNPPHWETRCCRHLGNAGTRLLRAGYHIRHFGLACRRYMHFTSPIRRYPDLLTQRALIAALEKNERHTDDSIAAVGEHCSEQEVKADKAEWDCRQRLLCAAAKERVGECFSAFVSGTVGFGVFVSVPELNLEGLVRIADIPGYCNTCRKIIALSKAIQPSVSAIR